jgi:hypothetical protein
MIARTVKLFRQLIVRAGRLVAFAGQEADGGGGVGAAFALGEDGLGRGDCGEFSAAAMTGNWFMLVPSAAANFSTARLQGIRQTQ